MTAYLIVVIALGVFEISKLAKSKSKKEIAIYSVISLLSIGLAVYYFKGNPSTSISKMLMDFFNIEH